MKRTILSLVALLMAAVMNAQTAVSVLDKASAEYKKSQSVTAEFEMNLGGNTDNGTILLQGTKFRTTTSESTIWFDGKTMWTYMKDNEEVNVTEPSATQLAKINPYAFLNMYKKGYDVAFGGNTSAYYEVILTAKGSNASIQKAIIRINKGTYQPRYIMMGTSRADIEISIKSYKAGGKQADTAFRFDKKKYPKVDVIDLR